MPWNVSPARSRELAPTRSSSWHQDPVAQDPGSMAAAPQGVFSRGCARAPTLCHHEGHRGIYWGWCGRAQPCLWGCRDSQEGGLAGCTCSARLSTSSSSARRGLFPIRGQAALTDVAGESPLLVLGHRGEAQHLGHQAGWQPLQPWVSSLVLLQLLPSLQQGLPPAPRGVPSGLGAGAAGRARGSGCSRTPRGAQVGHQGCAEHHLGLWQL